MDPCVDPADASNTYALFTESGEWLGPDITSVAELKAWWASENGATWRDVNSVAITDMYCVESLYPQGSHATASSPTPSPLCANDDCSVAYGSRQRAWAGSRDGALMDSQDMPYWESGGQHGGQCSCDAPGMVPGYINNPSLRESQWTCESSSCANNSFPSAFTDPVTNSCVCDPEGGDQDLEIPFQNGISYKHPNARPTCVSDPCNPMGVNAHAMEVSCSSDANCGGVCEENQCYIPTGASCRTDVDCSNALTGLSQDVARCVYAAPAPPWTCSVPV